MILMFVLLFQMAWAQDKALSFNQALDTMMTREIEVKIRESELRTAETNHLASKFRFLPTLNASASRSSEGDPTLRYDRWGLSTTLNLFRFGADWQNLNASEHQKISAQNSFENEKLSREKIAASLLFNFISLKKELEVRNHVLKTQQDFKNIAETRYKKGLLSLQDYEKVSIDLTNQESALNDKFIEFEKVRQEVIGLLGHDNIQSEWPWIKVLQQFKKEKNNIKSLVENHPSFRAQKSSLEASRYLESKNYRMIWPSLDLTGSYGDIKYENADPTKEWAVRLTLTAPLFSRLEDYSNYKNSTESMIREDLRLQLVRRELEKDLGIVSRSIEVSIQSAQQRDKTLSTSRKLFQANLQRWQAGRVTVNELNDDQRRLSDAEVYAVSGWKAAHESLAQFCYLRAQRIENCLNY